MTQGIQRRTHSFEFSPAYLAKITPHVRPALSKRPQGWFVEALRRLAHAIVPTRDNEIPDALIEDVGLGTHRTGAERRSQLNRLDAQLYARFY